MENKTKTVFKKVGWITLATFIYAIVNGASIAWLAMKFIGNGVMETPFGLVEFDYFETLDLKWRALIYAFILVGLLISFAITKILFTKKMEDARDAKKEANENSRHRDMIEAMKSQTSAKSAEFSQKITDIMEGKK